MVFSARSWDRWLILAFVVILGLSSGVASIAQGDGTGVGGHTTFVRGIRLVEMAEQPERPPIEYGLATHRDTRLFGLWKFDRPVPESQDRMVFAWSADAPDPRDTTVFATGDYAQVRDRLGIPWTVHEFSYLEEATLHYTYGVRVGALRHADDVSLGADGAYNYVLVYRPERLLQPQPVSVDAVPGAETAGLLPVELPLPSETVGSLGDDGGAPDQKVQDRRPQVAFGVGDLPRLGGADPAVADRAAPSPPGIPDLPDS